MLYNAIGYQSSNTWSTNSAMTNPIKYDYTAVLLAAPTHRSLSTCSISAFYAAHRSTNRIFD